MAELLVDFITSLDRFASGEGWPGRWGLQGPVMAMMVAPAARAIRRRQPAEAPAVKAMAPQAAMAKLVWPLGNAYPVTCATAKCIRET